MVRASRSLTGLRVLALASIGSLLFMTVPLAAEVPQDPVAVAETYAKQAAELRTRAEQHQKMAKMYRAPGGHQKDNTRASIARHCERIAANLLDAAQESEQLAEALRGAPQNK